MTVSRSDTPMPQAEGELATSSGWTLARVVRLVALTLAVTMGLFHLYTAGFGPLEPMKQRNLHLTFALVLAFLFYPTAGRTRPGGTWWDVTLAVLATLPAIHLWLDYRRILNRIEYVDPITLQDHVTSVLLIGLVLAATRRVVGWPMVIVAGVAIIYAFAGPWIPGFMGHRGLSWDNFLDQQVLTLGGLYTTPIAVSATYVVIFVLFGAFLVRTGMGQVMIDLARAVAGHTRGGPAKVAVLSSSFFGSINGSSVANVVATGSFTIPLMKGTGYKPRFAGAVEAVASTGGQLMPPVMGAAAFIMVEMTGISYVTIIAAALLPALLYYGALLLMVHLEASRLDMPVQKRASMAEVGRTLLRAIPFSVPIGVLLYVLMQGFSPIYAGFYATLTLIAVAMLRKETRLNLQGFIEAFELGARNAVVIAVTCAAAGIVIGVVVALGVGIKFASAIFTTSGGIFPLALLMVMVGSIVLGMGLPTSAAYVIVAAVAAPPLINMGMEPLAAHLFVLYFACLSSITPPVAVAAYAGAGIAGADPTRTGITAARLGIAGFIIPFLFAYWPALLMQGPWYSILHALVPAALGVLGLAIGVIGWMFREIGWVLRLYFVAAGLMMLVPGWWTDAVGALLFFPILFHLHRSARERRAATAPGIAQ